MKSFFYPIILAIAASPALSQPHWEYLSPQPAPGSIAAIDFPTAQAGYLITDSGLLMKSRDGGQSWIRLELPLLTQGGWDLDFVSENDGWVLGGTWEDEPDKTIIFRTSNGGASWNYWEVSSPDESWDINSIEYTGDGHGWAAGLTRNIMESHPAVFYLDGNFWRRTELPGDLIQGLNNVDFINLNLGWACGPGGYIARTGDGGRNWDECESGADADLFDISFADFQNGWAVGGDFRAAIILRTTNGGETWTEAEDIPVTGRVNEIVALEARSAWAVSDPGLGRASLLFTRDGATWEAAFDSAAVDFNCLTVNEDDETAIWVGGSGGLLFNSTGGRVEVLSSRMFRLNAYALEFPTPRHGWLCGDGGALFRTDDGGDSWQPVNLLFGGSFYEIAFAHNGIGFLTGQGSTEYRSDDGGDNWQETDIADGDILKIAIAGETVYALHEGNISKGSLQGGEWEEFVVLQSADGLDISAPAEDICYVASPSSALLRTVDGGEHWAEAGLDQAMGCQAVFFLDEQTGWAIGFPPGSANRVYSTTNGGERWLARDSFGFQIAGIEAFDANNLILWGEGGEVWYSADGGIEWVDLDLRYGQRLFSAAFIDRQTFYVCGSGGLLVRRTGGWMSAPLEKNPPVSPNLIRVWPNPTNGYVNVALPVHPDLRAALFDINGRRVQDLGKLTGFEGLGLMGIDLSGLTSGEYLLEVSGSGARFTKPILLMR